MVAPIKTIDVIRSCAQSPQELRLVNAVAEFIITNTALSSQHFVTIAKAVGCSSTEAANVLSVFTKVGLFMPVIAIVSGDTHEEDANP